jgi:hypothetical protein
MNACNLYFSFFCYTLHKYLLNLKNYMLIEYDIYYTLILLLNFL